MLTRDDREGEEEDALVESAAADGTAVVDEDDTEAPAGARLG